MEDGSEADSDGSCWAQIAQAESVRTMVTEIETPPQADSAHRVAKLNRNDKPFHVVLAQQFDRTNIEQLCQLADMIRSIGGSRQGTQFLRTLLSHRRVRKRPCRKRAGGFFRRYSSDDRDGR